MISYREATNKILAISNDFGTENVSLFDSLGRILAQNIEADRDYPPFDRATMDGIAICFGDFQKGTSIFSIIETIFAGDSPKIDIVSNQCYRIMTGAAVPSPADTVIKIEDLSIQGEKAILKNSDIYRNQNVAKKGEDKKYGNVVLHSGIQCTPSVISSLAALGKDQITVTELPTVAIVTTGNEIVNISDVPKPFEIRNSNQAYLYAGLKMWGIEAVSFHVLDKKEELSNTLAKVISYDIIICTGGVSAGDADYIPEVLKELGVEEIFHKIKIKPGKPLWFGRINKSAVFALPGNPMSCQVALKLFIEPYISACLKFNNKSFLRLPMAETRNKKNDWTNFFLAQLSTKLHRPFYL